MFWYIFAERQYLMSEKPPSKDKTIHISPSTHDLAKKITKEHGLNFGAFCDRAILERAISYSNSNSPFAKLSTQTLIDSGWKKQGNNYLKGNDVIRYMGTYWLYNGETTLTEQNYLEKIK
jgi:hypothetical protein